MSFWFNTNRVFEENPTTNGLSDVVDALLYFQVLYLQQAEVTRERVYAMHQSSIDGVEDMSALAELHEAAIMHNLYQRYHKDNIYVSVSSQTCVSDTWAGASLPGTVSHLGLLLQFLPIVHHVSDQALHSASLGGSTSYS